MVEHPHPQVIDGPGDPSGRPAFSADGVDLTLVRWFLALTPGERLRTLVSNASLAGRVVSTDVGV